MLQKLLRTRPSQHGNDRKVVYRSITFLEWEWRSPTFSGDAKAMTHLSSFL